MPEGNSTFELVIIGGGPGGYVAAIKAAQLGIKTALIEKDRVGGTCLHRGCIPTKALLHSADLYLRFLKANEFGITVDKLGINYPQFHRRKEAVVKRLFQGTQFLLKKNGVEVFPGEGQLTSSSNVLIKKKWNGHWQNNYKKMLYWLRVLFRSFLIRSHTTESTCLPVMTFCCGKKFPNLSLLPVEVLWE